jgi:hypothetical protein
MALQNEDQYQPGALPQKGPLGGATKPTSRLYQNLASAAQKSGLSNVNYNTHSNQRELSRGQSQEDEHLGLGPHQRASEPLGGQNLR